MSDDGRHDPDRRHAADRDPVTAAVATDLIVLGVDGRVCAAHPRWMTPAQATRFAESLLYVAAGHT
jgi:hypothetical protein